MIDLMDFLVLMDFLGRYRECKVDASLFPDFQINVLL